MDVKSEGEVRDDVADQSEIGGLERLSRDTVSHLQIMWLVSSLLAGTKHIR